ncbi:hypothetical protein Tco_0092933 [Tanacetum coccineum]
MALGYQNPFYLKQAQQKQQSLYNGKVLLEKHDPPVVYDSEETLQLAQESRLKMKQLNKEIKPTNYAKINQLSEVFVSQKAKSREELYFSNILTKMGQVAKFVRDFKSLTKEADESLSKQKALEYEIERLLRAVVSQNIMSIMQNPTVVETFDLQTKLERTKERIERLQAQLGDLKGKSKDTPCVSDTLDPLYQKLEDENVELEFQTTLLRPKGHSLGAIQRMIGFHLRLRVVASRIKEVEVEKHCRNLLFSKNQKRMSSECNNIRLAIRDDKYEVVCAMCRQCLITFNHDVCVLHFVKDINSCATNQNANVSNAANPKKHKPQAKRPKKLGPKERLASHTPWVLKSESSKGDNACTSNPQEPTSKRFPNSTFYLAGCLNLFMVCRLGVLKAYERKSEASHKFRLEVSGNRPLWK